jgi:ABC-type uncharacterized transport system ATPase subunit
MPLLVVNAILVISLAILNESTLSFLRPGRPDRAVLGPDAELRLRARRHVRGGLVGAGRPGAGDRVGRPGLTLLGHGLEQVLNPRLETHHLMPGRPVVQTEAGGVSAFSSAGKPVLLEVQNLSIDYITEGKPPAHAVENVSFTLHEGELMGLVGESGCGKTTLMLGLLRLLPAAGQVVGGKVYFMGRDVTAMSEQELLDVRWDGISIIFQGAMNALNPVRTVGDQIKRPSSNTWPSCRATRWTTAWWNCSIWWALPPTTRSISRTSIRAACASGR